MAKKKDSKKKKRDKPPPLELFEGDESEIESNEKPVEHLTWRQRNLKKGK